MSVVNKSAQKLKAKGRLETIWQYVLDCAEIKDTLNIKYISYDWLGDPGWFIWLEDVLGVYQFKIKDYTIIDSGNLHINTLIRYFPNPQEDCFHKFSFAEKIVRKSELFPKSNVSTIKCDDDTEWIEVDSTKVFGIPNPQGRKFIHPSLFIIGEMSLEFNQRKLTNIEIKSQNVFRTISIDGIYFQGKNGKEKLLEPLSIDRSVRGFNLTWKFASKIAIIYMLICSKYPNIYCESYKGIELLEKENNEIKKRENDEIKEYVIKMDFNKSKEKLNEINIKDLKYRLNKKIKGDLIG